MLLLQHFFWLAGWLNETQPSLQTSKPVSSAAHSPPASSPGSRPVSPGRLAWQAGLIAAFSLDCGAEFGNCWAPSPVWSCLPRSPSCYLARSSKFSTFSFIISKWVKRQGCAFGISAPCPLGKPEFLSQVWEGLATDRICRRPRAL